MIKKYIMRVYDWIYNTGYKILAYVHNYKLNRRAKIQEKWYKVWKKHLDTIVSGEQIPSDLLNVKFECKWWPCSIVYVLGNHPDKTMSIIATMNEEELMIKTRHMLNYLLEKRNLYINEDGLLVLYNVNSLNVTRVRAIASDTSNAQIIFKTELGDIKVTLTPYRDIMGFLIEGLTKELLT